jgi:hypothetical protein
MVRKRRIHYSETDKAVMWDRWRPFPLSGHTPSARVKID